MPKFKDGTVCRVDSTLNPGASAHCGLGNYRDGEVGPVKRLYEHPVDLVDRTPVTIYSVADTGAIPACCLVAVEAQSPLADWEPIEYRSPEGDRFIQWDGIKGGWMILDDTSSWVTKEVFSTPEAAAEWVAEENAVDTATELLRRVLANEDDDLTPIFRDIRAYLSAQEKKG